MANHDPRIDAYIAKSAGFARPILQHLRATVHGACPEVQEDIKWSMPSFIYKDALLCMMASFKHHCSFSFWLSEVHAGDGNKDGMGQFGKLTSMKDVPSDKSLTAGIRTAMALNDAGVKKAQSKAAARSAPLVPGDLAALLAQKKHTAARKTLDGLSPAAQRDYIDWITEAKADATRQKRIATALEWLADGKRRNWKYEKC